MATASLPELPRGTEFEEMIAAAFQGAGYFVERDIVMRENIEILQIDSICTDYTHRPPLLCLIEAKSGDDWGFKTIFKINGWKSYLNITRALLVTARRKDRFEIYQKLSERVGVNLVFVENPANLITGLSAILGNITLDNRDVAYWRFTYWAERALLERMRHYNRLHPGNRRFKAIIDHAFHINSNIFFTETVADRVKELYETYSNSRNLTGRCGQEIKGGDFDTPDATIPEDVFRQAFFYNNLDEIHAASWFEHKARLSLLKAAVDYLCYKANGHENKADKILSLVIDGQTFRIPITTFPRRFEEALLEIEKEPAFRRYPVFWQWFLGVFGGFILKDYEEQELSLLSEKTGVPLDQIDNAFAAYHKLFPVEGGWFSEDQNSNIRMLKLYPNHMRGVGANYRRLIYTDDAKFDSMRLTGRYTLTDLQKWTNAAVRLLTK